MTHAHDINSDTCDLRVEFDEHAVFFWVKEDAFDGKVTALTQLDRDDARKLHDILRVFLAASVD